MQTSSFKLYDLIVDIAPGMLLIGLVIPLFPVGSGIDEIVQSNSLSFGAWVLFVSYVVGRLVHGFSATVFDWLHSRTHSSQDRTTDEPDDRAWFSDELANRDSDTSEASRFRESIREWIVSDGNSGSGADTTEIEVSPNDRSYERLYTFGESVLYSRESLYRKYEMLATFYRSLVVVFSLGSVLYVFHAGLTTLCLYSSTCIGYSTVWGGFVTQSYPFWFYWLPVVVFPSSAWLSRRRRNKFIDKKRESFLNDFALYLSESDTTVSIVESGD
jgi:hypothetical protein